MKNTIKILLSLMLATVASQAQAVPCADTASGVFTLGTTTSTGVNSATNSVSTTCMDGAVGDNGNTEWNSGSLTMDSMTYDALQKTEWNSGGGGVTTEFKVDIGLTVTPTDTQATFGTWSFTNVAAYDSYVIVLKDGGTAPDGVKWSSYLLDSSLFAGSTWTGDWVYGLGLNLNPAELSYLAVYGKLSSVPEPGMVGLLAIGVLGMLVARRRMKV